MIKMDDNELNENEMSRLKKIVDKIEYPSSICECCNTFLIIKLDEKNIIKWIEKIGKVSQFPFVKIDYKTLKKAIKNNIDFDIVRIYDKKYNVWSDVVDKKREIVYLREIKEVLNWAYKGGDKNGE
ncbi:MAG: hypothetical protein N2114_06455 [Candidatus Goldbacteria bacterium]|nr:hypothetical protein [Candidatus Goldiibacteriota bacterium]